MIDIQHHVSLLSLASAASAVHRRNTAAPAAATAPVPAAVSSSSSTAAAAAAAGTPCGWCALESAAVSFTSIHREKYSVDLKAGAYTSPLLSST